MSTEGSAGNASTDSTFFLKIVLYLLIGSLWLEINVVGWALPIGLAIGLIFASHDHFQIDRKLEYVVLLIATVVSFAAPIGVIVAV